MPSWADFAGKAPGPRDQDCARCRHPAEDCAKVDKVDEDYFRNEILPLIDGPGVEFIGEINEREKTKFLGEAAALLFPVDWPEPFGLVMIEAMACGTPVLAFRCGSIPEIIEDGVTGKMVDSEEEAVAALPAILSYDRRAVRQRFEERFTATRMAKDYVSTYRRLLKTRTSGARQRQLDLNGGNGLAPVSIEKPFAALFEAGADPEIPPEERRVIQSKLASGCAARTGSVTVFTPGSSGSSAM